MLAAEREVSSSARKQAPSGLLSLHKEGWAWNGLDVPTTMIYTHVLKVAAGGTTSPLDALAAHV